MRTVLVVGCASCVWDDVAAARALATYDAVYCVKQIGIRWPEPFQVWATLHPEAMDDYEAQREALGFPAGYEIVAPLETEVGMHGKKGRVARRVTYRWPGMTSSASSGIYGVKVALDDGFDRVVIAGIPMSHEGGHFLPETRNMQGQLRGDRWLQRDAFMPGFEKSVKFMKDKVRSMSGLTMETLGSPTREWLGDPAGDAGATPENEAARG